MKHIDVIDIERKSINVNQTDDDDDDFTGLNK